jgi:hypothetical protein
MTDQEPSGSDPRNLPLVAIVSGVPMLREALRDALEGIAEVRNFPAGRGDTAGLLRSLRPDAVVVDSEEEAESVAAFARESDSPLVFVSYRDEVVKVLADSGWEESDDVGISPEGIRNVLVAGIFGRARGEAPTR